LVSLDIKWLPKKGSGGFTKACASAGKALSKDPTVSAAGELYTNSSLQVAEDTLGPGEDYTLVTNLQPYVSACTSHNGKMCKGTLNFELIGFGFFGVYECFPTVCTAQDFAIISQKIKKNKLFGGPGTGLDCAASVPV